jgi:hypothetical protein
MTIKIASIPVREPPHFLIHMALSIQQRNGGDLATILKERYGVEIDAKTLEKIRKVMVR